MPKINQYLIENKKPVELVQELEKYEIKKSPLSPAARGKVINKSGSGYVSEDKEGYGPMPYLYPASTSNSSFSITYDFKDGYRLFKIEGTYKSCWTIKGNIHEIEDKQWELETGAITIVRPHCWGYERDISQEEEIKKELRREVRRIRLAIRDGKWTTPKVGRTFSEDGEGIAWHEAAQEVYY